MHIKFSLIGLFAALTLQSQAADFIATNFYRVAKGEAVSGEQWISTVDAVTAGTFENDLFISTQNPLLLDGLFLGNVWGASASKAELNGACDRNIRLMAGMSISINGPVEGSLTALADTIIIGTNAVIGGDILLFANSVVLEGSVAGDARITATRIATLGGTVKGDANISSKEILFTRNAGIGGDLKYKSQKKLFPAEGIIGGKIERISPPPPFSVDRLTMTLMWFFAAVLAAIPFVALFPVTTAIATQKLRKSLWKCLLVGFLASGVLPVLGITLLLSSIISVPLGALTLALWGIMFYVGRFIVALVLGAFLLRTAGRSTGKALLAMILGLATLYLLSIVPSVGGTVQMLVLWLGLGSLILALLEQRRLAIRLPQNITDFEKQNNEMNNPKEELS